MADFPPNLDDGELWLPSDILPNEVVPAKIGAPEFPSELTYMEELAQQLSTYALLERAQAINVKPNVNFSPNIEVRPSSRYCCSVAPPPRAGPGFGFGGGGHNLCASGYRGFRVGLRPEYQYGPIKPASVQVERFVQSRVKRQNQSQSCFLPFRGNSGFLRESGGTGVFFPRVAATTEDRKKQSVRSGEECAQRQIVKKGGLLKKEVGLHTPPEMGLPKDWTY